MSVTWSGEGPTLLLALDRAHGTPLGHQLQDQLRAAVRDGRLRAGERLPSSRRLCAELQVSRGMVVACYEQLIAEGYLVGSAGSGTRVAAGVSERTGRSPTARTTLRSATSTITRHRIDVDFEYGVPDLRSAPLRDWMWALREAGRTAPTAVMGDEADAGTDSCWRSAPLHAPASSRSPWRIPGRATMTRSSAAQGCSRCPCPSTVPASTSTRSDARQPEPSSSPRPTSAPPAS